MLSHENSYGQGKARKYAEAHLEASGCYGGAAKNRVERTSGIPESGERKSSVFGVFRKLRKGTRNDIGRAMNG